MAATRIELPAQLESYLQYKIDTGLYSNGAEVIRDALRHMMEGDTDAINALGLRDAVQQGLEQIQQGQGIIWRAEHWRDIDQQAQQRRQHGKAAKADVCP